MAATPDGRADAVRHCTPAGTEVFAQPAEQRMRLRDFLHTLSRRHDPNPSSNARKGSFNVLYAQKQSDSLSQEFAPLLPDTGAGLTWADEAFASAPDATNLWIGDESSVTSFHKDHYENMYAVIRGRKTFLLLPPCEAYRLYLSRYPAARYVQGNESKLSLHVEEQAEAVHWSPLDPCTAGPAEIERYPLFYSSSRPKPFKVSVGRGDLLYLPSLWYHYVLQEGEMVEGRWCPCISVNMWYDMKFDCKYAYAKMIEQLAVSAF